MHNKRFNKEKYSFFNAATDTQWHKHKVLPEPTLSLSTLTFKLAASDDTMISKGTDVSGVVLLLAASTVLLFSRGGYFTTIPPSTAKTMLSSFAIVKINKLLFIKQNVFYSQMLL